MRASLFAALMIAACGPAPTQTMPPNLPLSDGRPAEPLLPQGARPGVLLDPPKPAGPVGLADPTFPIPDWPTSTPEAQSIDAAALESAATVAAGNGSYCLLVVRHGKLVFERYFQGASPTSTHSSWSIAKSYTSVLTGIAIDRGEIQSLDQSAADFVPEWKNTPRAQIKIRHLLSMTSGLEWSAFDDYVGMATLANDHTKHAVAKPLKDAPGTKWQYNNEAVQVFDLVFRNATGKTIEEYAHQHLWSKLGMSALWRKDQAGNPTPYANAISPCRDHAKFGYLLLHKGNWNGTQVVSQAYLAEALTPSQGLNKAYGFLFWLNGATPAIDAMGTPWTGRMVPFAPPDLFAAHGFGQQFIDVVPSLDLVVVRFGTDPMANFNLGALTTDSHFGKHDDILKPLLMGVH